MKQIESVSVRFRKRRCRALLAAAVIVLLPALAQAESVAASFDCAKAGSTVDQFICANAVLRWQDLAATPLSITSIKKIDLKPIAAARPEIVEGGGLLGCGDALRQAGWSNGARRKLRSERRYRTGLPCGTID